MAKTSREDFDYAHAVRELHLYVLLVQARQLGGDLISFVALRNIYCRHCAESRFSTPERRHIEQRSTPEAAAKVIKQAVHFVRSRRYTQAFI